MIRILPIVGTGFVDVHEPSRLLQRPEEIIVGEIGWNIKLMVSRLLVPCLQQTLTNMEVALAQSHEGLDLIDSIFEQVRKNRVESQLSKLYGPVVASNFSLAMNTTISLFAFMRKALTSVSIIEGDVNRDLIAQLSENLESIVLPPGADLASPMAVGGEVGNETVDIKRSLVLSFNVIAFSTLVLLTLSTVAQPLKLAKQQLHQLEQLLRDWTLDIMIQMDESLGVELRATGPFDISVPATDDDRDLAEMGLDDYSGRLE